MRKHIKHNLDPFAQAAEMVAARRGWSGGMSMELDPAAPPAEPAKPDDGAGSKTTVLADLAKERKARQALEVQVSELAPLKEQMQALAAALGVKPDKADDTGLDQLSAKLDALQRDNAVLALANTHGITEQADIDLLRQSNLAGDSLSAMAVRLKPAAITPGTPKPDASQGGAGDPVKPDPGPGLPRLAAAFESAFEPEDH